MKSHGRGCQRNRGATRAAIRGSIATHPATERMRYFDCHLHAAARRDEDLDNLGWFGLSDALVVPARLRRARTADDLMAAIESTLAAGVARLRAHGIGAHVAVSVPAAAAPRRRFDDVWLDLPELARALDARAIGRVELDAAGVDELFEAHAALAATLSLPAVLDVSGRTPQQARDAIGVFSAAGVDAAQLVVTGVSYTTLRAVLEAGCVPCVAVGPAGTSADDAAELLARFGGAGRRFVVGTTDAGALDVLAVPRLAASLRGAGWSRDDVERVVFGRAARLFGRHDDAGSTST